MMEFDLAPSTTIFCKEADAVMMVSKAYKEHWTGYGHFAYFDKFPPGKLPKVLKLEDDTKKRYLVVDSAKVPFDAETLANIIDKAGTSDQLQACFCF